MQVGELKGTFGGLKLDVEAMFMQMPSVDLDQLGGQLEAMQHHQSQQVADIWICRQICTFLLQCVSMLYIRQRGSA